MMRIYDTDYRGTTRSYFVPRQSGVIVPSPQLPGEPCPCPENIGYGNSYEGSGGSDNREILPTTIIFFSNAGSPAGRYRASSNFIQWPFEIDSLQVQESGGFGVSYLSYNLFLTEIFYNGQAGDISEPSLINYLVNVMDGTPNDLQSPIGPYIRPGNTNDNQTRTRPMVRCLNGANKRLGVGIKYTAAPGANSYLAFNFLLRRIG